MKLQIGDTLKDFGSFLHFLENETPKKREWKLSEELKKAPILIIVYPGDFTPVCTKQLCDYRDNWQSLSKFKVQIVGVSSDGGETHQSFLTEKKFPFGLLEDSDKSINKLLDMVGFIGMPGRGFVLIGQDQKVKYYFKETLPIFRRSASEVREILEQHL